VDNTFRKLQIANSQNQLAGSLAAGGSSVSLAAVTMHNPQLCLLDELLAGLIPGQTVISGMRHPSPLGQWLTVLVSPITWMKRAL